MRRRKKQVRFRCGAAVVEAAVVMPIIIFVIFSSIEFARVMMVRQAMTNAVREGCRDACLATTLDSSESEDLIRHYLRKVVPSSIEDSIIRVSIEPAFSDGIDSFTTISASVAVDCTDISWFPTAILSNAELRCTAKMVRE